MDIATCPSPADLQRLLLGLMPDAEARPLLEHVRQCDRCFGGMKTLDARDTLVGALDAQRSAPPGVGKYGLRETHSLPAFALPPQRATETVDLPQPPPAPAAPRGPDVTPGVRALLAPPQAPDELGRLGPYRVLRVLGTGACGVVFLAEDVHLQRTVALKAMKADAAGEVARQRFLREARAVAGIEHEHIVTVYQVGEDNGVPYLAMQLLRGETLDDRLQREARLPVREALRIAREVAEGLAAAHGRGLVHRDIKPANVWLEAGRGKVKIVDFGLARSADDAAHLTRTGTVVGTPAYMAPEQARAAAVDNRCDLFSLGCLLYRMVGGRTPFDAPDTMSMLLALAYEAPPPLSALNEGVPPALAGLVNRLLAKHPEGRPSSAEVVAEALALLEKELDGAAAPAAAADGPGASWLAPLVALLVLLVLGLAGYQYGPALARLATGKGVVVVKGGDAKTEVLVRQKGRVVERSDRREIELPEGTYDVELAAGKGTLSPARVLVERGGEVIVTVSPEKPAGP